MVRITITSADEDSDETEHNDPPTESGEMGNETPEDDGQNEPSVSEEVRNERRRISDEITKTPDLVAIIRMKNGNELIKQHVLAVANTRNHQMTTFLRVFPESNVTKTPDYTSVKRSTLCDGIFTRVLSSDDEDEGIELLHLESDEFDPIARKHIEKAIEAAQQAGLEDSFPAEYVNFDGTNIGSCNDTPDDITPDDSYNKDVKRGRNHTTTRDEIREAEFSDPTDELSGWGEGPRRQDGEDDHMDGDGRGTTGRKSWIH